jgi:hypothetical protein
MLPGCEGTFCIIIRRARSSDRLYNDLDIRVALDIAEIGDKTVFKRVVRKVPNIQYAFDRQRKAAASLDHRRRTAQDLRHAGAHHAIA